MWCGCTVMIKWSLLCRSTLDALFSIQTPHPHLPVFLWGYRHWGRQMNRQCLSSSFTIYISVSLQWAVSHCTRSNLHCKIKTNHGLLTLLDVPYDFFGFFSHFIWNLRIVQILSLFLSYWALSLMLRPVDHTCSFFCLWWHFLLLVIWLHPRT